jgi:hypothetical protein
VPCYRCGERQTDPERGQSPWRRGVSRDRLVLICPGCQESADWTAELEHCGRCHSAHLIRRLGQVECLDCGLVSGSRAPGAVAPPAVATDPAVGTDPIAGTAPLSPDRALADEVGRALDRLLGRA